MSNVSDFEIKKGWLVKYVGSGGDVVIPDSVVEIGTSVFEDCSSLTSVVIPDSVTSIWDWAFQGCNSLKSVTIPDSVTEIGCSAFEDCSSLTNVTIPNSVMSIDKFVFAGCRSLASVTIPDSITEIGASAFEDCSSLTSVVIPDSVTKIGFRVFSGCSSLTSVVIPDSVTWIDNCAFKDCSSLTSVVIPDSLTSIAYSVFSGCSSLTNVVIPDSVRWIDNCAFENCPNITIHTPAGSYAETYAKSHKIRFVNTNVSPISRDDSPIPEADKESALVEKKRNSNTFVACPAGYHRCNKEDLVGKHETDQGLLAMCLKGRIEDRDCGYYDVIECLCTHDKITLPHEIEGYPLRYNQTHFVNSHIKSIVFEYGINAPAVGQTWQFIGRFNGKLLDNLTELKTVYIPRGFIYVQGNRVVKVRRYEAETMPEFIKENIENIEKEYRKHYNELKQWFNRQVPVSEKSEQESTFPPKVSKVSPTPIPENQIGDPAFYSLMAKTFSAYPEMVTDRKRLGGLLRDVCPDRRKEINVLLQVFDLGIIEELGKQSEITHFFLHRIVKTLVEDYGTNEALAASMVGIWCLCYGRNILHLKCDEL